LPLKPWEFKKSLPKCEGGQKIQMKSYYFTLTLRNLEGHLLAISQQDSNGTKFPYIWVQLTR